MKKLTTVGLFLIIALAAPAFSAKADSISDIQAQIAAIMAQVQSLQNQVNTIQGTSGGSSVPTPSTSPSAGDTGDGASTSPTTCHTLTRYLSAGTPLSQSDATALQYVLVQEGLWDSSTAITSFDDNVAAAVVQLQGEYGIKQTGTVGPKTRAKLNSLYGCGKTTSTQPSVSVPTTSTQPSITVLSPNGGESYSSDANIDISYSSNNITGQQLTAYLYSPINGNVRSVLGTAGNSGIITLPLSKGTVPQGPGQYKITLCALNVDNPAVPGKPLCDSSNNYFTITAPTTSTQSSIRVLSPNGGETYPAGSTINIQWLGGDTDNVSISVADLSGYVATGPGGVGAIGFIAARTSNSHTYSWHIPSSFPPGSYKVNISPTPLTNNNQVESGTSNSYFTITAPTTSGNTQGIVVTSPVAGANWISGAPQTVSWATKDGTGNVGVFMRASNGWGCLVGQASLNSGSVSVTPVVGQGCPNQSMTLSAGSYSIFLTYPFVSASNPGNSYGDNSGQWIPITLINQSLVPLISSVIPTTATSGQQVTISGSNFTSSMLVNFSRNGSIMGSVASSNVNVISPNQLTFTMPATLAANMDPGVYQLSLVNSNGNSINSVNFTITAPTTSTQPSITVLSPSGGVWQVGQAYTISWRGASQSGYSVYLSGNGTQRFIGSANVTGSANDVTSITYTPASVDISPAGAGWTILVCPTGQAASVAFGCGSSVPFTITAPTTSTVPSITSLSPQTSVSVGDQITLYGTNFDQYSYVLIDGNNYNAKITSTAGSPLTFIVPSGLAAGAHSVQIGEQKGTSLLSNAATFTITVPTTSSSSNSLTSLSSLGTADDGNISQMASALEAMRSILERMRGSVSGN